MTVRQDAIGNLIGRYPGTQAGAGKLLLGSHLDTVRNAGKFDGALGVLLADCVCRTVCGHPAPFHIEVIAFADEEGVRFQSAYLGQPALWPALSIARICDASMRGGITITARHWCFQAVIRRDSNPCRFRCEALIGYVEAHMKQGPVLDHASACRWHCLRHRRPRDARADQSFRAASPDTPEQFQWLVRQGRPSCCR